MKRTWHRCTRFTVPPCSFFLLFFVLLLGGRKFLAKVLEEIMFETVKSTRDPLSEP